MAEYLGYAKQMGQLFSAFGNNDGPDKPLTLWANAEDNKLVIFFLFFPRKQDLTFHANCLHWKARLMSTHNISFSGEIRKKYQYFSCETSTLSGAVFDHCSQGHLNY